MQDGFALLAPSLSHSQRVQALPLWACAEQYPWRRCRCGNATLAGYLFIRCNIPMLCLILNL